jgi:hypothetical protein
MVQEQQEEEKAEELVGEEEVHETQHQEEVHALGYPNKLWLEDM